MRVPAAALSIAMLALTLGRTGAEELPGPAVAPTVPAGAAPTLSAPATAPTSTAPPPSPPPSAPAPAPAAELQLDDLERLAQSNTNEATQWAARRERMRKDAARIKTLADRLTNEQRREAWQRFLKTYADKDPFSTEDEDLRQQARAAIAAVGGGAPATPPAEPQPAVSAVGIVLNAGAPTPVAASPVAPAAPTVDSRLEQYEAAYAQAKRIDLLPGTVEAKLAAWKDFQAGFQDDVAHSTRDDELREWAQRRLELLAANPPILVSHVAVVKLGAQLDQGLLISAVAPDSLAARLGLAVDDHIVATGQPPRALAGDLTALKAYLAGLGSPDAVRLVVIRGDEVVASPAPAALPVPRGPAPARASPSDLGVVARAPELPVQLLAVRPGSLAEAAGLDAGDRILASNGTTIATAADLDPTLAALAADAAVELQVQRGGTRYTVAIPAAGGAVTWTVVGPTGWAPARPVAKTEAAPAKATSPAPATTTPAVLPAAAPVGSGKGVKLGVVFAADLKVGEVRPLSIAARLGVQAEDVLTAVGDPARPVANTAELKSYLESCTDPAQVRLVVLRRSGASQIVKPLPPPEPRQGPRGRVPTLFKQDGSPSLGILVHPTETCISAILPGSFAEAVGLSAGDRILSVSGVETYDPTQLRTALKKLAPTAMAKLRVQQHAGPTWNILVPANGGLAVWTRIQGGEHVP